MLSWHCLETNCILFMMLLHDGTNGFVLQQPSNRFCNLQQHLFLYNYVVKVCTFIKNVSMSKCEGSCSLLQLGTLHGTFCFV